MGYPLGRAPKRSDNDREDNNDLTDQYLCGGNRALAGNSNMRHNLLK